MKSNNLDSLTNYSSSDPEHSEGESRSSRLGSNNTVSYTYYLIPIFLWLLQAIYTFNSQNQLRADEIQTIRDILPLQYRALAGPGIAGLVAFHGTVMALFNVFGFDLFMPKFYRLGLEFVSLFCLSFLLKKYLGEKLAIVPLLTIGLSPTLLWWTTMTAPWGIDLQFFPIVLFLLDTLTVPVGLFVAMFAWLSYPNFLFYLPFLAWFYLKKLYYHYKGYKNYNRYIFGNLLIAIISFLFPLLLLYVYIEQDPVLYDPATQRGIFTAGGALLINEDQFARSTVAIFGNLFNKATSYMYEVNRVDFSDLYPLITVITIIIVITVIKGRNKIKEIKPYVFWCFVTIIFNIIITGFTLDGSGMPGGRRNTPILASIYGLFTITWYLIRKWKMENARPERSRRGKWKIVGMGILSLLLVHHIIVYPINLMHLQDKSPFTLNDWFTVKQTPQASVNYYLNQLQKHDVLLDCEKDLGISDSGCKLSSIYSALTQACLYNNLTCHKIKARLPFDTDYTTLNYDMFKKVDWDK